MDVDRRESASPSLSQRGLWTTWNPGCLSDMQSQETKAGERLSQHGAQGVDG